MKDYIPKKQPDIVGKEKLHHEVGFTSEREYDRRM